MTWGATVPIEDLARDGIVSASPRTSLPELARHMRDENVGSVVVTNDNSPTGIITADDLTELFADEVIRWYQFPQPR
jgi:CBS domain-containing protein